MFPSFSRAGRVMAAVRTLGLMTSGIAALGAAACDATPERDGTSSYSSNVSSAPEIVTPNIGWPPSSAIDQDALAALTEDTRQQVSRSVVPVLTPRGLDLAGAKVFVGSEFYALTLRQTGSRWSSTVRAQLVATTGSRRRLVTRSCEAATGS